MKTKITTITFLAILVLAFACSSKKELTEQKKEEAKQEVTIGLDKPKEQETPSVQNTNTTGTTLSNAKGSTEKAAANAATDSTWTKEMAEFYYNPFDIANFWPHIKIVDTLRDDSIKIYTIFNGDPIYYYFEVKWNNDIPRTIKENFPGIRIASLSITSDENNESYGGARCFYNDTTFGLHDDPRMLRIAGEVGFETKMKLAVESLLFPCAKVKSFSKFKNLDEPPTGIFSKSKWPDARYLQIDAEIITDTKYSKFTNSGIYTFYVLYEGVFEEIIYFDSSGKCVYNRYN